MRARRYAGEVAAHTCREITDLGADDIVRARRCTGTLVPRKDARVDFGATPTRCKCTSTTASTRYSCITVSPSPPAYESRKCSSTRTVRSTPPANASIRRRRRTVGGVNGAIFVQPIASDGPADSAAGPIGTGL